MSGQIAEIAPRLWAGGVGARAYKLIICCVSLLTIDHTHFRFRDGWCKVIGGGPAVDATRKVIVGHTECPLQVCQLSRSSESTHFLCLRRDVALFDSTRAPDSF